MAQNEVSEFIVWTQAHSSPINYGAKSPSRWIFCIQFGTFAGYILKICRPV